MKIGLIGSPENRYLLQMKDGFTARGHETVCFELPEVLATLGTLDSSETSLQLQSVQHQLEELDCCFVRTVPAGSLEQIVYRMDALWALEQMGVRLINPAKGLECAVDKYLTFVRLQRAGIAFPRTWVCESTTQAVAEFEKFGKPMILKPIFGSEGRGLMLIDSVDLLWRIGKSLEQTRHVLYLQEYLESSPTDLRLLVFEDEVWGAYEREKTTFRSNTAYQPIVRSIRPTAEMEQLAIKATQATGCRFAGVDLIHCPQRGWLVLEVNGIPGWKQFEETTGIHVVDRIGDWLESC